MSDWLEFPHILEFSKQLNFLPLFIYNRKESNMQGWDTNGIFRERMNAVQIVQLQSASIIFLAFSTPKHILGQPCWKLRIIQDVAWEIFEQILLFYLEGIINLGEAGFKRSPHEFEEVTFSPVLFSWLKPTHTLEKKWCPCLFTCNRVYQQKFQFALLEILIAEAMMRTLMQMTSWSSGDGSTQESNPQVCINRLLA